MVNILTPSKIEMRTSIIIICIFCLLGCQNHKKDIIRIIETDNYLSEIINTPRFEVQIIYTQIDRDKTGNPTFKTIPISVDSNRYFYPASTVKLPAAILSLEKLNELKVKDLDRNTSMLTDSASESQQSFHFDSTSRDLRPSIAHYIKKILLVSDNKAYNRLYEFLGQDDFNAYMRQKGFKNTRINHRLSEYVPKPRTRQENLRTNPIRFMKGDELIYSQPLVESEGLALPEEEIKKGKGYIRNDSLIRGPFDFTEKNHFHLMDQHNLLLGLFFPNEFPEQSFNLSSQDYEFVYRYMSMYPSESEIKIYQDTSHYWDAYVKFLLFGSEKGELPENIRIFNKVGNAYGYVIDNAFIVDFDNGIEFVLSAVIHANENEIYNDGIYEYDEIAFPFMKKLGQKIYDYELGRERHFKPDLSKFQSLY